MYKWDLTMINTHFLSVYVQYTFKVKDSTHDTWVSNSLSLSDDNAAEAVNCGSNLSDIFPSLLVPRWGLVGLCCWRRGRLL